MKENIELLAPGGDLDSIKAAIAAGADAVYCGLNRFNARNRAENISIDALPGILRLAHDRDCRVYLTLNIIIVEAEIPAFIRLLDRLANTGIDGIILQDIGMMHLVDRYFPSIAIHASTQLTTHNRGQIDFLAKIGARRVNLCRELNLDEIRVLAEKCRMEEMETEVFVHGSNCICFSGLCYMSSVLEGKSGNRGRCSQPCRDQYATTPAGMEYPLNLKDNCVFEDIESLGEAGVNSVKVEGRIKKFHYVYTVVCSWREQLNRLRLKLPLAEEKGVLHKVFNRDFSNGYLKNRIGREMFIDNPRDNSALRLSQTFEGTPEENLEKAKRQLYDEKTAIIENVNSVIGGMNVGPVMVSVHFTAKAGEVLRVRIVGEKLTHEIHSVSPAARYNEADEDRKAKTPENLLSEANLAKLLKWVDDSGFRVSEIDTSEVEGNLVLPFSALTKLKRDLFSALNDGRDYHPPVNLPKLINHKNWRQKPSLSLLIRSPDDADLCQGITGECWLEIPSQCRDRVDEIAAVFKAHPELKPWFPPVVMESEFDTVASLLERIRPEKIIANNSGVGFEAFRRKIDWIAGPYLNIVNSYSLLCLKERFSCSGAFISGELNNYQIKFIKSPEDFCLYYSIYHPLLLMTSRQCFFQEVTGCEKTRVDADCIACSHKPAAITTLSETSLYLEKQKGSYQALYNGRNFLNTGIIADIPEMFGSYFIDLRDIKTDTATQLSKAELVQLFAGYIAGDIETDFEIKQKILNTTCDQYIAGV